MIRDRVRELLSELPPGVTLVGAAKTRTPEEIFEAIDAGLEIVGENYVQEAERAYHLIGNRVRWHMIGHLQTNKTKKAAMVFDMVETVGSVKLALELDKVCGNMKKIMPILIEINSGEEEQKSGVMPENATFLIDQIRHLRHIRVMGLMTMGPFEGNPEDSRRYFKKTREIFDGIKAMDLPDVEMRYLSMGMSNSYKVALEEGANLIRIGTKLFGERT
ncbi:MAG: YggS family pyridoxal phosphate-dependent enzyme [Deltaproteobacteria bacterium]|nr:YggS family pyridoxal phosphate-dependent enzyme [Deltaproteobacteria bacterium]